MVFNKHYVTFLNYHQENIELAEDIFPKVVSISQHMFKDHSLLWSEFQTDVLSSSYELSLIERTKGAEAHLHTAGVG